MNYFENKTPIIFETETPIRPSSDLDNDSRILNQNIFTPSSPISIYVPTPSIDLIQNVQNENLENHIHLDPVVLNMEPGLDFRTPLPPNIIDRDIDSNILDSGTNKSPPSLTPLPIPNVENLEGGP